MGIKQIQIPDLGTSDEVDVIEVHVAVGDEIQQDDSLITVEGEKATMEVPASMAGKVEKVLVNVGDKVATGTVILEVTSSEEATTETTTSKEPASSEPTEQEVMVNLPDLGTSDEVDVIECLVAVGDKVIEDDPILTLEGEKATMDVPSPYTGEVLAIQISVGDKVTSGQAVMSMRATVSAASAPAAPSTAPSVPATAASRPTPPPAAAATPSFPATSQVHAGPNVRRIAREFGIDLRQVPGSGHKGRVIKEDLQNYVKARLSGAAGGLTISPAPEIDFSKYGEVETQALNKIKRATASNVHRAWVTIPHVTHFDEADITDMEAFRQENKANAAEQGVKLTPLVFIMKAVVGALQEFPTFNASLDDTGKNLILKKYFHIGVAVDTPNGLVVPVIRDVNQKGIIDIAKELGEISSKARDKGLSIAEMEGSCMTISSLGGIGGTGFTPIVKSPDVAILGVSKARMQPVYVDGNFEPKLMLPFSLSYDHRVIDGAEAARFCQYLSSFLADIRQMLL